MKNLLGCLLGILLGTAVYAQRIIRKNNRAVPVVETFYDAPALSGREFKTYLRDHYSLSSDYQFQLKEEFHDKLGYRHFRYMVQYKNVQIEAGMFLIHERDGKVYMMNGDVFEIKESNPIPTLPETTALQKALQVIQATKYYWEQDKNLIPDHYAEYRTQPKGELVWVPENGNFQTGVFRLAYKFDIYAIEPFSKEFVYIDAQNGNVLWRVNGINETNVNGTTVTKYSGTQTFQTDSTAPGSYRLRDNSRGNGLRTLDKNNGTSQTNAVDFTDADNYWNNVNANQDEVAGDVHWGTQKVYDYYLNVHGRDSYDGNGAQIYSYVHHGNNYNNAFWDGTSMNYGDGNGTTFTGPLTCMDVVAHELTHGVTNFSANLVYSYESGALNESFSDIFGNTLERVAKPTYSWKIGEEITPSNSGIRNMANPNAKGDPDTYQGTNWYTGTGDNGGVHTNSGVQNFWYYILVEGDTATNDNNDAYSVPGIGLSKAADIAFRNLTVYLTPSSQYADARFFAIQSARDLFGNCSQETIQTTNAWYAVGVGPAYDTTVTASFSANKTASCQIPDTIQFLCTTINAASAYWEFGDGGTSNQLNPTHVYTQQGTYTVKCVVTGCNNSIDSLIKVDYITLDSNSIFCDTTQLGTSGTINLVQCSGVVVDDGGVAANYSDQITSNIRIASPPMVSHYKLKFADFATELDYDSLRIFNGAGTTSPLIGSYMGTALPNNGNVILTSDTVFYMRFKSDQAVNDRGFVMTYECVPFPPTAGFYTNDTFTCTGNVTFVNTSQTASNYQWDFGDGTTGTAVNPVHNYTTPGIYTVRLIAWNQIISDTLIRTAYVNYDPNALACNSFNQPAGTAPQNISNVCHGLLYDDGGANSNYSNNINNSLTTITGTPGLELKLNFLEYNLQSGDTLKIFDGNNPGAKLLGAFTNFPANVLPNGGNNIWSSSNQISVQFYSNGSGVSSGFKLEWLCADRNDSINFALLDVDTLNYCHNDFQFAQSGIIPPSINLFNLDAGDGTILNLSTPANHNYVNNGTFDIVLNLSDGTNNYYEYDQLITNRVFANANIPVTAQQNQNVNLTDISINGGNSTWYVNGTQIGTGSPVNTSFSQLGANQVMLVADNGVCSDTFLQTIDITIPDGLNDFDGSFISIYPNPTPGIFEIDFGDINVKQAEWILTDKTGKVILRKESPEAKERVDLKPYANGIYFLKINLEGQLFIRKILLMR